MWNLTGLGTAPAAHDPDWYCHSHNVTYEHRVDDPGHFAYCPVPEKGYDGLLFASVALLVACVLQGKLSALFVLIAGGLCQGLSDYFNLFQLSNSISLWLGIQPAELFLFAFLPPLLLDSAVNIEWFVFRKVQVKVMTFAFLVVLGGTALLVPLLLYVFGLHSAGWNWVQAALFSSIIASTDAVTVNALLKAGGGPEDMTVLMEGESLFNDASSMVLFTIFFDLVQNVSKGNPPASVITQLPAIAYNVLALAIGGAIVGYVCGYTTRKLLGWLQSRGAKPEQEVGVIIAGTYLSFYLGQAVLDVSGVIAVVVFGLYGSAQGYWDLSNKAMETGAFKGFMSTLSFCTNEFVFFFAGASGVNFVVRSLGVLDQSGGVWHNVLLMFAIYISMFIIRFLCILLFNPFFKMLGAALPWNVMIFATVGGLRGALSLIMVQVVIQDAAKDNETQEGTERAIDLVTAQMVLWTAGFVLLTLLVNAPLIPTILKVTGLTDVPAARQVVRAKAKRALLRFTHSAIHDLKVDEDETLRGVDWNMVAQFTNLEADLKDFGEIQETPTEDIQTLRQMLVAASKTVAQLRRHGSEIHKPLLGDTTEQQLGEDQMGVDDGRAREGDVETGEVVKGTLKPIQSLSVSFDAEVPLDNVSHKTAPTPEATTPHHLPPIEPGFVQGVTYDTEGGQGSTLDAASGGNLAGNTLHVHLMNESAESDKVAIMVPEFKVVKPDGPASVIPQSLKLYYNNLGSEQGVSATDAQTLAATERPKLTQVLSKIIGTNSAGGRLQGYDVVMEARVRLISGVKRFLHSKRREGLLSSRGLRILEYWCDFGIEEAHDPLNIWSAVEKELVGHWVVSLLVQLHYCIRKAHQSMRGGCFRYTVQPVLSYVSGVLSARLSNKMLLACETAIAYFHALTFTPFAEWLKDSHQAAELREEVDRELDRVWRFIIYREIEAPQRFSAIQSYRAAMSVLSNQLRFIDELYHGGIVDEAEQEKLYHPVERRMRELEAKGATWKAPRTKDLLRELPFFVDLPDHVFEDVVSAGTIRNFHGGDVILSPLHSYTNSSLGTYVVINGLVKAFVQEKQEMHEFFMGSGSFFGLMACLTGNPAPGSAGVAAEGNSLGKGPVLFHIPLSKFQDILEKAHAGDEDYQQLELNLFRVAALTLIERTKRSIERQALLYYYAIGLQDTRVTHKRGVTFDSGTPHSRAAAQQVVGGDDDDDDDDDDGEEEEDGVQAGREGYGLSADQDEAGGTNTHTSRQLQKIYKLAKSKSKAVMSDIREAVSDSVLWRVDAGSSTRISNHAVLLKGTLKAAVALDTGMQALPGAVRTSQMVSVKYEAPCTLPWLFAEHISSQQGTFVPQSMHFEAVEDCWLLVCNAGGSGVSSDAHSLGLTADKMASSSVSSMSSISEEMIQMRTQGSKLPKLRAAPFRQYSKRPQGLSKYGRTKSTAASDMMTNAAALKPGQAAQMAKLT